VAAPILLMEFKGFAALATQLARDTESVGLTPDRIRASAIEIINRTIESAKAAVHCSHAMQLGGDTWYFLFDNLEEAISFGCYLLDSFFKQATESGIFFLKPSLAVSLGDPKLLGERFPVLIARNQTVEMPYHFNLALDNGVKPGELSEIITHLAFYSGQGNALSAVAVAKDVFSRRGIGSDQLPPASGELLPLDEAAEAQRAARVEQDFGQVAPGVVKYTGDVLFRDLWLRPALAPRDRSLVTVSALIALGQVEQIPYHLNRAMDNGLTKAQASEVLTHLAFYAGWPNVFPHYRWPRTSLINVRFEVRVQICGEACEPLLAKSCVKHLRIRHRSLAGNFIAEFET
jgi:4-carboxymuconolactone decarboxylase